MQPRSWAKIIVDLLICMTPEWQFQKLEPSHLESRRQIGRLVQVMKDLLKGMG